MTGWFAWTVESGAAPLAAIAIIAAEIALLSRRAGAGRAAFLANGVSGMAIMAALAAALAGLATLWVAALLGAGLAAHLAYLGLAFRAGGPPR